MTSTASEDAAEVIAANTELYAAIEAGDVERIDQVWDRAAEVVCVHPGWSAVRGRSRVMRSWAVIMANTAYIQYFLTSVEVEVSADVAVVTCEHGVLARTSDSDTGLGETARIVATNVFRRRADGWRLVAHHASQVLGDSTDDDHGDADE